MPCYDKKLEASRSDFFNQEYQTRDVDCVLTTGKVISRPCLAPALKAVLNPSGRLGLASALLVSPSGQGSTAFSAHRAGALATEAQ